LALIQGTTRGLLVLKELNRFNQIGVFFTRAEAEQWL
jgi:hypothetical protein